MGNDLSDFVAVIELGVKLGDQVPASDPGLSAASRMTVWRRVRAIDDDDVRLVREGLVAATIVTVGQIRPGHCGRRRRHDADADRAGETVVRYNLAVIHLG